ncbi:MAG: hypothetical protein AAF456_09485 [Planctomycetota bacterium]
MKFSLRLFLFVIALLGITIFFVVRYYESNVVRSIPVEREFEPYPNRAQAIEEPPDLLETVNSAIAAEFVEKKGLASERNQTRYFDRRALRVSSTDRLNAIYSAPGLFKREQDWPLLQQTREEAIENLIEFLSDECEFRDAIDAAQILDRFDDERGFAYICERFIRNLETDSILPDDEFIESLPAFMGYEDRLDDEFIDELEDRYARIESLNRNQAPVRADEVLDHLGRRTHAAIIRLKRLARYAESSEDENVRFLCETLKDVSGKELGNEEVGKLVRYAIEGISAEPENPFLKSMLSDLLMLLSDRQELIDEVVEKRVVEAGDVAFARILAGGCLKNTCNAQVVSMLEESLPAQEGNARYFMVASAILRIDPTRKDVWENLPPHAGTTKWNEDGQIEWPEIMDGPIQHRWLTTGQSVDSLVNWLNQSDLCESQLTVADLRRHVFNYRNELGAGDPKNFIHLSLSATDRGVLIPKTYLQKTEMFADVVLELATVCGEEFPDFEGFGLYEPVNNRGNFGAGIPNQSIHFRLGGRIYEMEMPAPDAKLLADIMNLTISRHSLSTRKRFFLFEDNMENYDYAVFVFTEPDTIRALEQQYFVRPADGFETYMGD